jgi:hypothetical protein
MVATVTVLGERTVRRARSRQEPAGPGNDREYDGDHLGVAVAAPADLRTGAP